ncbi:helix-hairpin-helix domain-containing protein [Sorangium sp. So ce1036]|uniref:ComEA family DNA-binding protein n=1 Tax=Sorangium sp. So ce1036 TaxID=3133328 RepID=UPI003F0F05C4
MPEKGAREHVTHQVDLNTASEAELAEVSDIGAQRARKIVEYREQRGGFDSVDDLMNVEGFGPTLTDDLRSALTVSGGRKVA